MRFYSSFSHFLAAFNNRQEEVQNVHSGFWKNATFHSECVLKTCNSASSQNTLDTAKRTQFYSTFLPTTISLPQRCHQKHDVWLHFFSKNAQNDRKRTVTKATLNFTPRFQQQRSVMLLTFGENGEWLKISNIWANLKKIFENVGSTVFCIYKWLKHAKQLKNRLWKSRACVPLTSFSSFCCLCW